MLECAKQLETFETYKLQGAQGCLKFASNFLTKINLHRAECLDSLVVYAPRLEKLSLQVCFWIYRHSSFNAFFLPRKNRVKGKLRYRRNILVLKPKNWEYESSKSTFSQISNGTISWLFPFISQWWLSCARSKYKPGHVTC